MRSLCLRMRGSIAADVADEQRFRIVADRAVRPVSADLATAAPSSRPLERSATTFGGRSRSAVHVLTSSSRFGVHRDGRVAWCASTRAVRCLAEAFLMAPAASTAWSGNPRGSGGHDVGMEDQRRLRLESLFVEHAAAVRAYVLRRSDPVDAEDVVMEVFVIACRRLEDMPPEPLPWLLGCARRVLANHRRGARRANALIEKLSATITSTGHGAVAGELLGGAMSTLSEHDREVLLLAAWEGLAPSQIAEVVGCSRTAAAVRLHRARGRLRAALSQAEAVHARNSAAEVLR